MPRVSSLRVWKAASGTAGACGPAFHGAVAVPRCAAPWQTYRAVLPTSGACRRLLSAPAAAQLPAPVPGTRLQELRRLLAAEAAGSSGLGAGTSAGTGTDLQTVPVPALPSSPMLEQAQPLLDTYGRRHTYLRMSLTERCNLRCTYCMPAAGVPLTPAPQLLSPAELARAAAVLVRSLGVTKIRLTGGEPTLRRDLEVIVAGLARLRQDGLKTLAMTTNGVLLPRARLAALAAAGLTHVNISLDTLRPERFAAISRRPAAAAARVWDAIHAALDPGVGLAGPVKVNCVVMRGVNDDELAAFVGLTRDLPLEVRFIELMPFAGNDWDGADADAAAAAVAGGGGSTACSSGPGSGGGGGRFMSYQEMVAAIRAVYPTFGPLGEIPHALEAGADSRLVTVQDTAKRWGVAGHAGSVGFITTISDAFCGTCNRVRLTADGALKVCLHGNDEMSLRDVMRTGGSDADVAAAVRAGVAAKHFALGGNTSLASLADATRAAGARPMVKIGG
jgi:cyclic pyranopterin phosphate synthase